MSNNSTAVIFGADVSSTEIVIACADGKQAIKKIANQSQAIKT